MLWTSIILLALAAVTVLIVGVRRSKKRRLSSVDRKEIDRAWDHVHSLSDSSQKILEADKILDLALTKLGYTGSLGEKLKAAGPRIKNLNAVWSAHKLRNTIAHEVGVSVSEQQCEAALKAFRRAIDRL